MKTAISPLLMLLAGCALGLTSYTKPDDVGDGDEGGGGNGGGDGDVDLDTDDWDTDPLDTDGGSSGGGSSGGGGGSLSIDDVDPWWGISDGGLEVTVTGSGFTSGTEVFFGGTEATVNNRTSSSLLVETPEFSGIDESMGYETVAVKVEDESDSDSAQDAFTYYLDGANKAGAIGSIEWIHWSQSAKSGLSGGSSLSDYGVAGLYFITPPRDMNYWDLWAGSADSCTDASYDFTTVTGDVYLIEMGPTSITLAPSSGSNTTLSWDSSYGGYFNTADMSSAQVPSSTTFDLRSITAGYAPEDFNVSNAAKSSSTFTLTSPLIDNSTLPLVSQSSLNFTWSTTGSGQRVMLYLAMMNSSGTTLDEIWCVATDDGSFTVPSSAWSTTWTSRSFMWIQVGRAVEDAGTLPYNNGETRIAGIYWNVGIGYYP